MNLRKIQSTINEIDALLAEHESAISAADGSADPEHKAARSSLVSEVNKEAASLDKSVKEFKELPSHTGSSKDGNWEKLIEVMKTYRQAKLKLMDFDQPGGFEKHKKEKALKEKWKAEGTDKLPVKAPVKEEEAKKESYAGPERRLKPRAVSSALKASVEGDMLRVSMLLMSSAVLATDGPTSIFEDMAYLYRRGKKAVGQMALKRALHNEGKELDQAVEAFKNDSTDSRTYENVSNALAKYKRAAIDFLNKEYRKQRTAHQAQLMKSGRPTTLWKEQALPPATTPFAIDLASEKATMAKVMEAYEEIKKAL